MAKSKQSATSKKATRTAKKTAEPAARATKSAASKATAGESTVTLDRRANRSDRRKGTDRRQHDVPVAVERRKLERRAKVNRRRQIDPTTCERDYSAEEIEFMSALDDYKRTSGRMFPTCSEILEVFKKLGYQRPTMPTSVPVEPLSSLSSEVLALTSGPALLESGELALS